MVPLIKLIPLYNLKNPFSPVHFQTSTTLDCFIFSGAFLTSNTQIPLVTLPLYLTHFTHPQIIDPFDFHVSRFLKKDK